MSQDTSISTRHSSPETAWLKKQSGGTETTKIKNLIHVAIAPGQVDPEDDESIHFGCELLIKRLQETSQVWN